MRVCHTLLKHLEEELAWATGKQLWIISNIVLKHLYRMIVHGAWFLDIRLSTYYIQYITYS